MARLAASRSGGAAVEQIKSRAAVTDQDVVAEIPGVVERDLQPAAALARAAAPAEAAPSAAGPVTAAATSAAAIGPAAVEGARAGLLAERAVGVDQLLRTLELLREVEAPAQLLPILARKVDRADVDPLQIAVGVAGEAIGEGCLDRRGRRGEARDRVADAAVDIVGGDGEVGHVERLQRQSQLLDMAAVGVEIRIAARRL